MTILTVSLICDAHFLSLPSPKNITQSMPWLTMQVPRRTKKHHKKLSSADVAMTRIWRGRPFCDDLIRHKTMNGPTKPIWKALYSELNCKPITFYACRSFLYQSSPFAHITTHSSFNPLQTLQSRAQLIEDRFTQDQHKCSHIYHLLILVALI